MLGAAKRSIKILLLFAIITVDTLHLAVNCSHDYSSDRDLYGDCLTSHCGLVTYNLSSNDALLANELFTQVFSELSHSTSTALTIVDLASNTVTNNNNKTVQVRKSNKVHQLTEQFVDKVGASVRFMAVEKFGLPNTNSLRLARPLLLSQIRPTSSLNHAYTHFHADQLSHADTTAFHYTTVIYLDTQFDNFTGGSLEFSSQITIRPTVGLAVLFTSGEENMHRVTRVENGQRRAITVFMTCDKHFSLESRQQTV